MLPSAAILSRRRILAGAGALVTCCGLPAGAQKTTESTSDGFRLLRADAGSAGPGPLLRIKRGEELRLRFINNLPEPTALHWHGVRVPNLMDGAPGLTSTAVAPGARFDYRFSPPDAGTYWYHTVWSAAETRQRLYGALIVDAAEPTDIDREHVLAFDDGPDAPHAFPQRNAGGPSPILTNGMAVPDLAVRANERVRLRLINAARARVIALRLDPHHVIVMALDGQPSEPFRARDDRILLGPGNTADLFIDATLEPGAVAPNSAGRREPGHTPRSPRLCGRAPDQAGRPRPTPAIAGEPVAGAARPQARSQARLAHR